MPSKKYTFLALGDSYTIGESVPSSENFPAQTVHLLQKAGLAFGDPVIIAKTGWTTDDLAYAIKKRNFSSSFDFVTLLIGVNNQYQGGDSKEYAEDFTTLLKQSIAFANGKNDHVVVVSIPDWGVTPFGEGRDRAKIAAEIDDYNRINKSISAKYHVHYADITPGSREAAKDPSLVAADNLHPSAKEYAKWAEKVAAIMRKVAGGL